jgi:hypothetical protein
LHLVLYECETWSLTLREELRVFEDRVLRRILGPKRDLAQDKDQWRALVNTVMKLQIA